VLVGEIKIDASGLLGDAEVHGASGTSNCARDWAGTASDLLRVVTYLPGDDISKKARTGQDIPAPSPAGCVACKLSFA